MSTTTENSTSSTTAGGRGGGRGKGRGRGGGAGRGRSGSSTSSTSGVGRSSNASSSGRGRGRNSGRGNGRGGRGNTNMNTAVIPFHPGSMPMAFSGMESAPNSRSPTPKHRNTPLEEEQQAQTQTQTRRQQPKYRHSQSFPQYNGGGATSSSSLRQQSPQQQSYTKQKSLFASPSSKPIRVAGQLGAEAHTVSEDSRIRLTQMLVDFREKTSSEEPLEFSSNLSNTERKFLHELAAQLGLKSKSSGKGEERRITITKPGSTSTTSGDKIKIAGTQLDQDGNMMLQDTTLPLLEIGHKGEHALQLHIQHYPPTSQLVEESYETGRSLLNALRGQQQEEATSELQIQSTLDEFQLTLREEEHQLDDTPDDLLRLNAHRHVSDKQRRLWVIQGNEKRHRHSNYDTILKHRQTLPAWNYRQQIVDTVASHKVTIITGDTGCGKSTQVPQFILDSEPLCHLVVTQPRRISAMSVADRVSYERCEAIGESVGYNIRLEKKLSKVTQCVFVTPGILLKKLQSNPTLEGITHVILDEVHERDKHTEFLMICLRDLLSSSTTTTNLKVILMSATLQTNELTHYWRGLNSSSSDTNKEEDDIGIVETGSTSHCISTNDDDDATTNNDNEKDSTDNETKDDNDDNNNNKKEDEEKETDVFISNRNALPPPEVNIPGRTFPVQEFYLEDILQMTGYVDNDSGFSETTQDMAQLEADLANLLGRSSSSSSHSSTTTTPTTTTSTTTNLTCCMCGKDGFRVPEELGTHIATCIGPVENGSSSGVLSFVELEEQLRQEIGGSSGSGASFQSRQQRRGRRGSSYNNNNNTNMMNGNLSRDRSVTPPPSAEDLHSSLEDESDNPILLNVYDDEDVEDDEDMDDYAPGRPPLWDGSSSFMEVNPTGFRSSLTTKFTEDELLRRYHTTHDDEQIDNLLLLEVVKYICQSSYALEGAILIFFPGWMEISQFQLLLQDTMPFSNSNRYWILPLHSSISSKDQRKVFQRPPFQHIRKIVLATNIAETSVTIDDVAFVVDTGRAKEKSYDPHLKTSTLQPVWISQASSKQRQGRAGRTQPGVCFKLYSRQRFASFRPFVESELMRTPLEEMCLQTKRLGVAPGGPDDDLRGITAFLQKALTPPHPKSIQNALENLVELGALVEDTHALTNLGFCLSHLSLEPRIGKMVLWSHLLGCAKMGVAMAVAMSYKSPFVLPPPHLRKQADECKIKLSQNSESDQVTVLNILKTRDQFMKRNNLQGFYAFCQQHFLNASTMNMISELRSTTSRELVSLGFPPSDHIGSLQNIMYHNRHNHEHDPMYLHQASIVAGLFPNVASRVQGEMNFSTKTNRKAKVHMSSLNSLKGMPLSTKCRLSSKQDVEFIIFGEMLRGKTMFTMNQTSHLSSPLPLVLLCGQLRVRPAVVNKNKDEPSSVASNNTNMAVLSIDDWICFQCSTELASKLVILRSRLNDAFETYISNRSSSCQTLLQEQSHAVDTMSVVLKSAYHTMKQR